MEPWRIHADANEYKGKELTKFLQENGILKPDVQYVETLQAKNGDYRRTGKINDRGMDTRSHMPFLDPPKPPTYIGQLPQSFQEKIELLRDQFNNNEKEKVKDGLRDLAEPYLSFLENIPGGVHNANEESVYTMAKSLDFNPDTTVWLELGAGAMIFGMQASVFTKETICIDFPDVMYTIFENLAIMTEEKQVFLRTIHMIAGT